MFTKPWMFLVVTLAGWLQRHQQDVIEYLQEENRVVRDLGASTSVPEPARAAPCPAARRQAGA